MKNIIKSSLKNTLVTILLIGSVVVLVTAFLKKPLAKIK